MIVQSVNLGKNPGVDSPQFLTWRLPEIGDWGFMIGDWGFEIGDWEGTGTETVIYWRNSRRLR